MPFFHLLVYYYEFFVDFQSRGTGHLVYLAFLLIFLFSYVNNVRRYIILGMLAGLAGAYTPKPAISLYLAIAGYAIFCMFGGLKKGKAYILRSIPIIFSILLIWLMSGGDIFIKYFVTPRLHVDIGDKWYIVRAISTIFLFFYPLYFLSAICFILYIRKKILSLDLRVIMFSFMTVIAAVSSGFAEAADALFPKQIPMDLASISSNINNFMVVNIIIIFYISLYYICFLLKDNAREIFKIFRSNAILLTNILVLSAGLILWRANKLLYDWVPYGYNNFIYLSVCLVFVFYYSLLLSKNKFVYKHFFLIAILLICPYCIPVTKAVINYEKGFIRYFHPEITIKNKEIKLINWIIKNIPKDSVFFDSYLGFDQPNAIMAFSQCRMFLAYTWTLGHQTNYDYSGRVKFIEKIYKDSILDIKELEKFNLKTCGYALFFDFRRDLRKNYDELKNKYDKQLKVRYEDEDFAILYYES